MRGQRTTLVLAGLAGLAFATVVAGCTVGDATPTTGSSFSSSEGRTGAPVDSTLAPTVVPVVVVADVDVDGKHVTASGYVAGILESDGTCTFRFKSGDVEVSAESNGMADRSTTACEAVHVPIGEFSKGSWQVTMIYTGTSGDQWTSETVTMEVA